jgi:hypothetical protein
MSKARDLANAGTALGAVTATELGYVDGVTSAIQTQIDGKEATLPSQTGNSGKYLTTNGTAKSWGTVSQYALPSQTGNSGKFLTTNGTAESWATVNQPLTWTQRLGGLTNNLYTAAYNGTNLYVAAGTSGLLYSSPDGITWTSRTSGFSSDTINRVAYGNGLWVAVGDAGKITTSTDGTTWTARTSNMGVNDIYDVVYANSIWVAVGLGGGTTNTGGLTYSTDGLTWTRKSQSIAVGTQYHTVIWNGTNWIIGASLSDYNYIYATTPSGTWTGAIETGSDTIHKIIWDGTRHTYFGTSIGWRYSTSTSTLASDAVLSGVTSPTSSQPVARNAISYYNGTVYQGNFYWNSFVPTSTGVAAPTQLQFSPTASLTSSGSLTGALQGVIAVPAGLIMLGSQKIYTSF